MVDRKYYRVNESSDRKYYRVNESSPVMGVIQQAMRQQQLFNWAAKAFHAEFAGATIWTAGKVRIAGVQFPGDLPAGWRQGVRFAVPDKRYKAGREVAERLKAMPRGIDAMTFSSMMSEALNAQYDHYGEENIAWTIFEKYGEVFILSVPAACAVRPPGCVEMKMSEYWAIKETTLRADTAPAVVAGDGSIGGEARVVSPSDGDVR